MCINFSFELCKSLPRKIVTMRLNVEKLLSTEAVETEKNTNISTIFQIQLFVHVQRLEIDLLCFVRCDLCWEYPPRMLTEHRFSCFFVRFFCCKSVTKLHIFQVALPVTKWCAILAPQNENRLSIINM